MQRWVNMSFIGFSPVWIEIGVEAGGGSGGGGGTPYVPTVPQISKCEPTPCPRKHIDDAEVMQLVKAVIQKIF